MNEDMLYKKQLNAYDKDFKVWQHSDGLMVIGHEARLITPYNVEEGLLGFFAVFESQSRGKTLRKKLESEGVHIKAFGDWEMTGYFSYEKLPSIAKMLKIRSLPSPLSAEVRERKKVAILKIVDRNRRKRAVSSEINVSEVKA